jgi:hypothetical protein
MSRGRAICEAVHLWALGLWLGALILAAAAAAIIFPALKDLDPSLAAFSKYQGPHWVLAGGRIGARVFMVLDVVQVACVLIAGLTLAIAVSRLGLSVQRVSTFVRVALVLGLVAILAYRLALLEPSMQKSLRSYWAAAAEGDNGAAARYRAEFDAGHPQETRLLGATAALVAAAGVGAFWSMGRSGTSPGTAAATELEEPALLRGRR